MVQESFKALKNTNINPLSSPYKTARTPRGQFFYPYTLPKERAVQVRNFEIFYKLDNQLLLEYVM